MSFDYAEQYARESARAVIEPDDPNIDHWNLGDDVKLLGPFVHIFICPSCDSVLAVDLDQGEALHLYGQWLPVRTGELDEIEHCYYCWEQDQEGGSTITRFDPDDGKSAVRFGDWFANDTEWSEIPDWFNEVYPGKRDYQRFDGWRGAYDTKFPSLQSVFSGWVTGDWGDGTSDRKLLTHRLYEFLDNNEPPVEVFWLFEPTSNVFSTSAEVFVRMDEAGGNVERFKQWLNENGFDPEAVADAFS